MWLAEEEAGHAELSVHSSKAFWHLVRLLQLQPLATHIRETAGVPPATRFKLPLPLDSACGSTQRTSVNSWRSASTSSSLLVLSSCDSCTAAGASAAWLPPAAAAAAAAGAAGAPAPSCCSRAVAAAPTLAGRCSVSAVATEDSSDRSITRPSTPAASSSPSWLPWAAAVAAAMTGMLALLRWRCRAAAASAPLGAAPPLGGSRIRKLAPSAAASAAASELSTERPTSARPPCVCVDSQTGV